jgi:hypothetical protein
MEFFWHTWENNPTVVVCQCCPDLYIGREEKEYSLMPRQAFNFNDIEQECRVEWDCHRLDNRNLGARVSVPAALSLRNLNI